MPDLAPTDRFRQRMTALETRYQNGLALGYREIRRQLLSDVERLGITSPVLGGIIRQRMNLFGEGAKEVGRELVPQAADVALEYQARNIRILRKLKVVDIDVEAFQDAIEPEVRRRIGDQLDEAPAEMVDAARAALLGEAGRLRRAGDNSATAVTLLLGTTLQNGRASAWRRGKNSILLGSQVSFWASVMGALGWGNERFSERTDVTFQKQCIAALDERTTDCCLRAHAQVQPIDKPFKLTGTPRFADRVQSPPFHWNCRTSEALYHPAFEDVGLTTNEMRDAANAEIKAREETGQRVEIHPASAASRR